MTEIEMILRACDSAGVLCEHCRQVAVDVLHAAGLDRALKFARRQHPHGDGPNAPNAAGGAGGNSC